MNHLPTIHFHGRIWRLENASLLIFVGWRFRFWRLLGEDFSDRLIFVMLELLEEVEMVLLAFLLHLLRSCEFQPYHHHIVATAPLRGGGNRNEECFCFNLWGREIAMWASAQTWASNWAVELYRTYIEHFANRRTTLFGWWCSLQMSQIRKSWECRPWFFNGFLSSPRKWLNHNHKTININLFQLERCRNTADAQNASTVFVVSVSVFIGLVKWIQPDHTQPSHRSIYGCFLKWWYPQNTPKWSFLVGKPVVVGETHHFRKPPYIAATDPFPDITTSLLNTWGEERRGFGPEFFIWQQDLSLLRSYRLLPIVGPVRFQGWEGTWFDDVWCMMVEEYEECCFDIRHFFSW